MKKLKSKLALNKLTVSNLNSLKGGMPLTSLSTWGPNGGSGSKNCHVIPGCIELEDPKTEG